MGIGEAIALASGLCGLVAMLWKFFNVLSRLERQIDRIDSEQEIQELTLNGVKEKIEHTRDRIMPEIEALKERVSHNENWLAKNTTFEQRYTPSELRSKR